MDVSRATVVHIVHARAPGNDARVTRVEASGVRPALDNDRAYGPGYDAMQLLAMMIMLAWLLNLVLLRGQLLLFLARIFIVHTLLVMMLTWLLNRDA